MSPQRPSWLRKCIESIIGTRIAHTSPAQVVFIIRSDQEERTWLIELECRVENGHHELGFWTTNDSGENLNELFVDSMPRLFRAADCILHNYHDSEDALQDGLLSALRHIEQFKGNSQFSTWLFSIIRNSALAKLRRQRAHPFISTDEHGVRRRRRVRRLRDTRRSEAGSRAGLRTGRVVSTNSPRCSRGCRRTTARSFCCVTSRVSRERKPHNGWD